jgi:splicing factor 3B subunit 2
VQIKLLKWGELEEEDDESSDEEEQEEEEAEPAMTQEQLEQGIASGMVTGLASSLTEAGIGTDQTLDMRKASGTSTSGPTPALYTVLEQQKAPATDGLAAVDHTYKVPGSQRPANASTRKRCAPVASVLIREDRF